MFDRYEMGPRRVSVESTVNHKRAPTDESIRLLREMEEAARESVLETFTPGPNELKGRVIKMQTLMGARIYVLFDLNGKKHQRSFDVDPLVTYDRRAYTDLLVRGMTDAISVELWQHMEAQP